MAFTGHQAWINALLVEAAGGGDAVAALGDLASIVTRRSISVSSGQRDQP